jgi:esterase
MNLFFRKYGSGNPLLILHGLFGLSDNWNTLAKQFSEHGLEVYTLDLRNHGLSPHSEDWDYSVMAADIAELIDELGLSDCILLGHSMGGMVAMQVALHFPQKIARLIVLDMAPKVYPPPHDGVLEGLLAVDLKVIKTRKEADKVLSGYIKDEGTKQFLLKNLYWKDDTTLAWRFNLPVLAKKREVVGIPFDSSSSVSNVPALFIKGEKSDYILDSDHQLIKRIFPNARFISIPNAGHWVHAEQPKLFFEAVLSSLVS